MNEQTWIVRTTDGRFLALRYSEEAARRAVEEFADRWPQGVTYAPAPLTSTGCRRTEDR